MLAAVRLGGVVAGVVAATVLAVPGAAWAHGVGGSSDTVGGFVWLGTKHMLAGWDHLLFVGGILLLAGEIRRAAKPLSARLRRDSLPGRARLDGRQEEDHRDTTQHSW
jgi:hypothetical protein